MLILCDVDGTVADLHTPWIARHNKKWNDTLKYTDVKKWGIHEYCKPESGRDIYEILKEPDLYQDVPVIEGALEGVQELRSMGHRVVFVTAYFNTQKVEWLHNKGFLVEYPYNDGRWNTATDIIMVNDKSLIKGDLLIDDREDNLKGFDGILFAQPWNENNTNQYARAVGWSEVIRFIKVQTEYYERL